MVTVHHARAGEALTACGRDARRLTKHDDKSMTTCKSCIKANGPEFVGESRGRKQYKLTCKGGPWGGSEAVFAQQEASPLSIMIRVGEHVGRYNLNTGAWVPMEQKA